MDAGLTPFCSACDSDDCRCKAKAIERADAYEKLLRQVIQEEQCGPHMVYKIENLIEKYKRPG